MKFTKISFLFAMLFVIQDALAEPVPHLINYQGKLTGADGNALATGDYTLSFKIYNQASGGTPVWGPQVFDGSTAVGHGAKVPVVQGYFNVILGPSDTASPSRSIVNAFATADAYLEISVNGGSPILPRQRVLSAPYAISAKSAVQAGFALQAEKLKDYDLHTNVANQNIGIGTTTPASNLKLDVEGKLGAAEYCDENGERCELHPIKFELYNSNTTTYACKTQSIKEHCGDEDGCTIKILLQHGTDPNDQVRVITETIYMENSDLSNGNGSGIYGWTRQLGGGEYSWIMGTPTKYTLFHPWDWLWAYNYNHNYCDGTGLKNVAHTDPYLVTFMSHPNVRSTVIIYDR